MSTGIRPLTAMEIITNPDDLRIEITQAGSSKERKYGFTVSRGPRHSFTPLFSQDNVFTSRNQTVAQIKKTLKALHKEVRTRFPSYEDSEVLNLEQIKQVIKILANSDSVETYALDAVG